MLLKLCDILNLFYDNYVLQCCFDSNKSNIKQNDYLPVLLNNIINEEDKKKIKSPRNCFYSFD